MKMVMKQYGYYEKERLIKCVIDFVAYSNNLRKLPLDNFRGICKIMNIDNQQGVK